MERFLLSCSTLIALGCAAPRAAEPSQAAPTRDAAPSSAPPARAAPPVAPAPARASSIRVEPLPPLAPRESPPKVEISEPRFGDRLALLAIREQPVKLALGALGPGERVLVSLDGRRPRPHAPGRVLRLGELLPEDETIAEGAHVVLAVAADAEGRPLAARPPHAAFSLVDFIVGERPSSPLPAAPVRLFCLGPAGTFHGAEADRLVLSLLVVGPVAGKLPLAIVGDGGDFRADIDPGLAHALSGLPSGDVIVSVGAAPGPRASCVLTINRPLVVPRSP